MFPNKVKNRKKSNINQDQVLQAVGLVHLVAIMIQIKDKGILFEDLNIHQYSMQKPEE